MSTTPMPDELVARFAAFIGERDARQFAEEIADVIAEAIHEEKAAYGGLCFRAAFAIAMGSFERGNAAVAMLADDAPRSAAEVARECDVTRAGIAKRDKELRLAAKRLFPKGFADLDVLRYPTQARRGNRQETVEEIIETALREGFVKVDEASPVFIELMRPDGTFELFRRKDSPTGRWYIEDVNIRKFSKPNSPRRSAVPGSDILAIRHNRRGLWEVLLMPEMVATGGAASRPVDDLA